MSLVLRGRISMHVKKLSMPQAVGPKLRSRKLHIKVKAQSDTEPAKSADARASNKKGILATKESQALNFGLFAASSFGLAALALGFPELQLYLYTNTTNPSDLEVTFAQIFGATLLIQGTVEICLMDAAQNSRLSSATYQRLMVGLAVKSAIYVAAFLQNPAVWTPLLTLLYPTQAIASVSTTLSVFEDSNGGSFKLPGFGDVSPKTPTATVYLVLCALYLATAAACFAPEAMFNGNVTEAAQLIKHSWAPGFTLAAFATFVLKDAADRNRLGASTFKKLNFGLAALEALYTGLFAHAIMTGVADANAASYGNLGCSAAIALFCGFMGLTSKK